MTNNNVWMLARGRALRPAPFCIAAILNLTPDSFSDGSGALPPATASLDRARLLLDAVEAFGCGMLDMGAESTRPGSAPVAPEEESARLRPVLKALRKERPDALLSIDTCRAGVAAEALNLGADIINDVSACSRDPGLTEVLAQFKPGYVLTHGGREHFTGIMHMGEENPVDALLRFFEREMTRLSRAGLPEEHIVLDPGIGFGKSCEENWRILGGMERLSVLGRPLYAGISKKSLFGGLLGLPVEDRGTATQVTTALLAGRGIAIHRVHDAQRTAQTLAIVRAMQGKDVSSANVPADDSQRS